MDGRKDGRTPRQCSHSRRIVRDSRRNFNNRACYKYHTRAFTHVFQDRKKTFSSDHIARIVILISFFIVSSLLLFFNPGKLKLRCPFYYCFGRTGTSVSFRTCKRQYLFHRITILRTHLIFRKLSILDL